MDGDEARAEAMEASLRAHGWQVVAVLREAGNLVEQVRRAAAEVIVCDVEAPSRDTIESMRALDRDEPRPVVMFVDRSDPAHIRDALDAGVAAYVIEGLAPGRVKPVIDVAIARFRAHQALKSELLQAKLALSERKLIERAKGILMRTRAMSEEDAYRAMRRLAMDQGKRLPVIAESVIALAEVLQATTLAC